MKRIIAFLYFALIAEMNLLPVGLARADSLPANLIANPSAETADASNPSQPQSWLQGGWGTNTSALTYENTGHTGSRSLKVQTTAYTSGDAKWYFTPVSVTASTQYTYSDYYESSVTTYLVAQFDNGSGSFTYTDLKTQPASPSAWTNSSVTFTTPATAKAVTIFHLIENVGWLQTDDFSLTTTSAAPAPTPPTVNITTPAANATVSGTAQVSASASGTSGIAGVQFKLDGNNLGSEITGAPYSYNWDTTAAANGSHTLTATARDTSGLTSTATETVSVNNSTSPPPSTTNMVSNPSMETANSTNSSLPANWQTGNWGTNTVQFSYLTTGHTGSRSVKTQINSYSSGDAKWYFAPVPVTAGTQYAYSDFYQSNIASDLTAQFDDGNGNYTYVDLGTQAASASWKQAGVSFTVPAGMKNLTIFHLISGVGYLQIDDASLAASNAPSVSLTSPQANATVSGSVQLTAAASAGAGVASVQFLINGSNQGPAVTASPYQTAWDTTKVSNGSYSITAVVTDKNNQTAASSPVMVTVSNQPAGANLIPNPSLETVSPSNSKLPLGWTHGSWGSNSVSFSYPTSGHTGTRSIKAQISSYSSGSAYWYSNSIPVTGGQMYEFSDYYKSNTLSVIDAGITMSDGSQQDLYIGEAYMSPRSWTEFDTQFTVPAGAVSITFYHSINSVGWLQTDDYSLTPFSYQVFNRPIVSLTFDDGYESFYKYGLPLLQKYGFQSTDYIITGKLDIDPSYMSSAQVKQLNTAGQDVESHTVTHPDLATLTATAQDQELKNSQAALQSLLGVPVKGLATPYGSANQQVITDAQKYYSYVRGVEPGYNSKNNFDPYNILVQNVDANIPINQVQQWVQQAIATKTWLVLVYHEVDPTLTDPVAAPYNINPADLDAELAYLQSTHVAVETMAQAIAEITPQL